MSQKRSSALAVSEAAPLFAALGDETRLKLVSRLCNEGPLSITCLSEGSQVTRQAITKHLRALSDAGLVHDTRQGRERIFELRPKRIEKARQHLEQISQEWEAALGRLHEFLRKNP